MISVVIPCYNAAETLRITIESALTQDEDKEIIVINDGSSDSSAEIIASFGDKVRAVATPNRGASAARNLGTELARGRFLQYLDSDDVLMPGTLSARWKAIEDTSADVAHTDWQKLKQLADGSFDLGEIIYPDVAALSHDAELATATSSFWAPPAALLYRRSIIDRIGSWSPCLPVIQDARFLFDAAANGARFVYVPGVGARYRVLANSLSRRSLQRFVADCAINARDIETLWSIRGSLSGERRSSLASMWEHVIMASLLNGLPEFEEARLHYNRVATRRAFIEAGLAIRKMLGPSRAAAVLLTARRGRTLFQATKNYEMHVHV